MWVLLEDRLARLAVGDFLPWIVALRKASAIEVPYQDRWELLNRLWQLPSLPETSLPPNLRCEEVHVPPQGRLVVHSPDALRAHRLYGDVEFLVPTAREYRGTVCAGMVDPDKERILVRDRDKERELLAFWPNAACGPPMPRVLATMSCESSSAIGRAGRCLVQAGWIVEAEGASSASPASGA